MIPTIKNILYVSDISEGSRPAFRMAVSLAEKYDAKITFLHVIEPIPDSVRVTLESTLSADAYSKIQSDGAQNLKEIIQGRIQAFSDSEMAELTWKPQFDSMVVEGIIHKRIIEVADKLNAGMVVMGTRTHSATKQFFMGSTANKVMRHSDVPVLVVPLSS